MKVIFLDRDGVINRFPGRGEYVKNIDEFSFLPRSIQAIKKFNQKGYRIFIVSNQAGIAKGIYSWKELEAITIKMLNALKREGASLDGVYYCPHRDEDNCLCRKPKTGLLEKALQGRKMDYNSSFFIGDSLIDVETAKKFGITSILVLTGREKISERENWYIEPDYIFKDLFSAAEYICTHY